MTIETTPIIAAEDWRERTAHVVETVREMSRQTDPQEMVRAYGERMLRMLKVDRHLSLSRRGLERPKVRITRNSAWKEEINPWKQRDKLPVIEGGLLGEWIWGDEPRLIDDLHVDPGDPAYEYLKGYRSVVAMPHYHEGQALNMVVHLRHAPGAFDAEAFPELVLTSNLFGRATNNLVLSAELKTAYESLDRELRAVAEIQRALLPPELPAISTLELAAYYQTSRRAGGDYYDFFPLPEDQWGIFIGDVSGHGTPSAVLMAITHTIAHSYPGDPMPPGETLGFLNRVLTRRYTQVTGNFVTAFYGIYDGKRRRLTYARAGHNPPRWCREGRVESLDAVAGLPLGIEGDEVYEETTVQLTAGDQVLFYTDGITEVFNGNGEMFDVEGVDGVMRAQAGHPREMIAAVLDAVKRFAGEKPPVDDQTLIAARVR